MANHDYEIKEFNATEAQGECACDSCGAPIFEGDTAYAREDEDKSLTWLCGDDYHDFADHHCGSIVYVIIKAKIRHKLEQSPYDVVSHADYHLKYDGELGRIIDTEIVGSQATGEF